MWYAILDIKYIISKEKLYIAVTGNLMLSIEDSGCLNFKVIALDFMRVINSNRSYG